MVIILSHQWTRRKKPFLKPLHGSQTGPMGNVVTNYFIHQEYKMSESIKKRIHEYIKIEMLFSDENFLLTYEMSLLGSVIDSMGLQMLVPFLETEYKISIPDNELIPENFYNINSIAEFVARLLESKKYAQT